MIAMLLKMTGVTSLYVLLTFFLWKHFRDRELSTAEKIAVGIIYGGASILSTHFGIDYGAMLLNVRDLGPLSAGLFFSPSAGIIAGLIGGIERYIAGTYFGVASFTRVACSISTCLAGFLAAFLNIYIFNGKKPSALYAFFMGAVIEVFHMYVVFATHRDDMDMAFMVVRICSVPMIMFSGIGLAASSLVIKAGSGELRDPFKKRKKEDVPVFERFSIWLLVVISLVLVMNYSFMFTLQSFSSLQDAKKDMEVTADDIKSAYTSMKEHGGNVNRIQLHVSEEGTFVIADESWNVVASTYEDDVRNAQMVKLMQSGKSGEFSYEKLDGVNSLCYMETLDDGCTMMLQVPMSMVFETRSVQAYESILMSILVFTVIYVLIALLVQRIVVDNLLLVNDSLKKITDGNLEEEVKVYDSSEFASLSADINQMVTALKGFIDAARKRIEQELQLAHSIQESALPKNFDFNHEAFEIYASMDPAREVGGDFYDFFFVEVNKIALVIADVSGKGIPASLYMMRSKTAIRGLAETGSNLSEVFNRVNNELCRGDDTFMFVTAWMGVVNLETGLVKCINAGHEYPAIMRSGGSFELFEDKHRPPLGAMEDMEYSEYELQLEPGDCIFVYTDGIPEALDKQVQQFGTGRMLSALNSAKDKPVKEVLAAVKESIDVFVGDEEQFDDVTMMGFKFNGIKK